MRVRIHRGTQEIGGSCIEIETGSGERLVLDVGRPLWAGWDEEVPAPDVVGFAEPDPSLVGIVISHPHLDHYGLLREVGGHVPVFIGREAESLLGAAAFFSPVSADVQARGHLVHREPFCVGPFRITPYLNDHSAFDAYSMLIEADGRRVFYSGDIRGHGRKAALFDQLLADPPTEVDVLLMEGTHVRGDGARDAEAFKTEAELEEDLVTLCRDTPGLVAVLGSAQNLDRVVTVYRAARRSGREFVIDLYGASVAAATRSSIPQLGHDGLRVYVPQRQRVRVKESGEFHRVAEIKEQRVYLEEVAADPGRFVFHVPSSTVQELIRHGALGPAGTAVWSMWDGYLRDRSGVRLRALLDEQGIPMPHIHTSGHASVADLGRLVAALSPGRLIPIHSEAGSRFGALFPNVELQSDGSWWEV